MLQYMEKVNKRQRLLLHLDKVISLDTGIKVCGCLDLLQITLPARIQVFQKREVPQKNTKQNKTKQKSQIYTKNCIMDFNKEKGKKRKNVNMSDISMSQFIKRFSLGSIISKLWKIIIS